LIPPNGEARWQALRLQALAQGLAESGSAIPWESVRRPAALRYPALHDGHVHKLGASYDWLERNLDIDSQLHVGHIALATTLSWIEFRQLPSFREQHPKLTQWLDEFEHRPSMRKTPLSGETHD
jgi:glutathione S-transferase